MPYSAIPQDIQRFILTSIQSVPHLEAILLLRREPESEWDAKAMAQRLFISEKKSAETLEDLSEAGFAVSNKAPEHLLYHYSPANEDLRKMMDRLVEIYAKNLIEVTALIHSQVGKQAEQFGKGFKWKQEKDKE